MPSMTYSISAYCASRKKVNLFNKDLPLDENKHSVSSHSLTEEEKTEKYKAVPIKEEDRSSDSSESLENFKKTLSHKKEQ